MGIQRWLASAGERERGGIGSGKGQGMRGSISSCVRVIASFTGKDDVIDNSGQKKKRLADAKRFPPFDGVMTVPFVYPRALPLRVSDYLIAAAGGKSQHTVDRFGVLLERNKNRLKMLRHGFSPRLGSDCDALTYRGLVCRDT